MLRQSIKSTMIETPIRDGSSIMNETVLAALISTGVSVAIALASYVTNLVSTSRSLNLELGRDRERADESITAELVRQRIEPYAEFMRMLEPASNAHLGQLSEADRKKAVSGVAEVFHRAIYGKVGLLASHETREVIVYARSRCRRYSDGTCEYEEFLNAIWAIHQMVRADLNLRQPKLANTIERLRNKEMSEDTTQIVDLVNRITHNRW
jgi:hypothetical protein